MCGSWTQMRVFCTSMWQSLIRYTRIMVDSVHSLKYGLFEIIYALHDVSRVDSSSVFVVLFANIRTDLYIFFIYVEISGGGRVIVSVLEQSLFNSSEFDPKFLKWPLSPGAFRLKCCALCTVLSCPSCLLRASEYCDWVVNTFASGFGISGFMFQP
jgi:hypothetical protein